MKLLDNKIENRQALLTIELESAEVENALERSYQKLVQNMEIPGFRKGKAPRSVLEQHIGRDALLEDALKSLLPQTCADVIKEQQIKPIAEPVIKVTQKEPLIFEATVPLEPIIKLADYYKIKMKPEKVKIKEDDISSIIEGLRQRNATYEPVERPVKVSDLVVIDVECSIGDKTLISEKGLNYQIISGMTYPAPGFPEQLLGMKRGEEKEFNLKLSKNYPQRELAEQEALFKVKVVEVKEEKLPAINDDLARAVAPDIENLDSLRERIATDLRNRAEENTRTAFEESLIDALIDKSELDYPPFLVDMEVNQLVGQHLYQLQTSARNKDDYARMLEKMPQEELRKKYRPLASKRVAASLVLSHVAEAERVEVSDTEIDAEVERMTQNAGDKKDEQKKLLDSPQYRDSIKRMLTPQKTIRRLSEIAQGSVKKNKAKKEAK